MTCKDCTETKAAAWDALNTLPRSVEEDLLTLDSLKAAALAVRHAARPNFQARDDELLIAIPEYLLMDLFSKAGVSYSKHE
mgnify:CR=1 FL=1